MNYLAHLYLSGESSEIKLGNFIGDYVQSYLPARQQRMGNGNTASGISPVRIPIP